MLHQWTFGIITGGDTASVNLVIESIEQLKIDPANYEIIIVGGPPVSRRNVVHIPFDESIKHMWITKKKQLICEHARFDNVALMHDYIIFDENWYQGWLRFGDDNWDVAMNVVLNSDGTRFRDWVAYDHLAMVPYDITGYHQTMYISGSYWVAKKQFMLKNSLDLSRGWCQAEDIEWSLRCRPFWNYKMNPYSAVRCGRYKETWGASNVADYIQYKHLETIINARCDLKVSDQNGFLTVNQDPFVRSIHYSDFDRLRNELRIIRPKKVLSVGDPAAMTSFAAAWVMNELGGSLVAADYMDNAYGLRLIRYLRNTFKWDHIQQKVISSPDQLKGEQYDVIILSGTYHEEWKLAEAEIAKEALLPKGVLYANINTGFYPSFEKSLGKGQTLGAFRRIDF